MVFTLEGSAPCDKFVDSDSDGPNVHFLIIATSSEYLGGKVEVGSNYGEHVSPLPSLKSFLANSKVNNFDSLHDRIVEYILGLDVPMTNISLMNIGDSVKNLGENNSKLILIFYI